MRFSDGYWQMRPGVRPAYPAQAYDIETTADSMTAHAPTRLIEHRGHTLGGPMVTARWTSPMPDVIRVDLRHLDGPADPGPGFAVQHDPRVDPLVALDETSASLTSGRLSVHVRRDDRWGVGFRADGRVLTASPRKGMAIMETDAGEHFMVEQLTLGVGENVYGLGERFGPFVKNGQTVDIWNEDGGTSSQQAYKNIPFYLTNRGYGIFVQHPGRVSFEVGSEVVSRVQFSVPGQSLAYFVIYGPTPKEILEKYTALTGRPALPPRWSFGLWLSTSFTTSYDEATVTSFLDGMAERDLPLSVFHFDCFWMREFHWCDFEWDPRTFPEPRAMLQRMHARGLRVCVWINPYIAQRSRLFAEGAAHGYLLRRPNGDVWQWDRWQPGMALVDFTNPAARAWYQQQLAALLDMGVDCFKTDFGERIPTDVAYHDGSDPERMHNLYTYLYNQTVFELLEQRRGTGEAVVFARSATSGSQQFPVHWGGDCSSTFESMAESLRGGLSLASSGFGFWSHDIGGFEGKPPPAVFKRWIAFGLLSSHSRLHGNESYRVPWLIDEESVDVLRRFTRLKHQLMPYVWEAAVEAHELGHPVMRPMVMEFPDDPACASLDRQYMLGESLLVAPVFSDEGGVEFYVPAGRWTSLLDGDVVAGPGWHRQTHDFLSLPLLVRPGSVIAMGEGADRPDYDHREGLTLQAYELVDGCRITTTVRGPDGSDPVAFETRRIGDAITVSRQGPTGTWRFLLAGATSVTSVANGSIEVGRDGVMVSADPGAPSITIALSPAGG